MNSKYKESFPNRNGFLKNEIGNEFLIMRFIVIILHDFHTISSKVIVIIDPYFYLKQGGTLQFLLNKMGGN